MPTLATSNAENSPLPEDTGKAARFGLTVLILGFGGFLLWAALAPLDEGVPCSGLVTIDTKRKVVQHLSGGIVSEVFIREGEHVKEGQVLLQINDAVSKANFESARQRYMGLQAMEDRLHAEQQELAKIKFAPDLLEAANDPVIRPHIRTQEQLFQSRRATLRAEVQAIKENIEGLQGNIASFERMRGQREAQLALFKEELKNILELVKEGYVPRNRQLELERSVADTMAVIIDIQGNITRAQRAISQSKQEIIVKQQGYRREVDTHLADVQREVRADAERYYASREELTRTKIKAPVTGQVVALAVQTVGGVIQPGQKLMDIVPENQQLLLEARIPPHVIDKVHAGLLTDVRFSTFAHAPQLVVEGEIQSVSGDLLTEQTAQGFMSYFLARVKITPEGIKKLGKHQLQPGMPADIVIKTGERSVLTYIIHPLIKRIAASMKEE